MKELSFRRREAGGVIYYTCPALDELPGIRHGFSTRHGADGNDSAASLNLGTVPWDTPGHVEENRRRFLSALQIDIGSLAAISQVHSAEFHIIAKPARQWDPHTRGDALVTAAKDVALAVRVADCFPILIAERNGRAIAAVHAGWRGTLARILERTVTGLCDRLEADPESLLVAIGPGIRPCCMEVGEDVASAFRAAFPERAGGISPAGRQGTAFLDLPGILRLQLEAARVNDRNVFDMGACTRCHPDEFFSYRAEGERSGRMMAVICRV